MENVTKQEVKQVIAVLKEKIKDMKRRHVQCITNEWIIAHKQLDICNNELEKINRQEQELKRILLEAKKEKELQSIPHLTQKLSYIKAQAHFNAQEIQALEFMRQNDGCTDTYTLSNKTGMHLRSAGRCLSILNKKGIISPATSIIGPYGRTVTVYKIAE